MTLQWYALHSIPNKEEALWREAVAPKATSSLRPLVNAGVAGMLAIGWTLCVDWWRKE